MPPDYSVFGTPYTVVARSLAGRFAAQPAEIVFHRLDAHQARVELARDAFLVGADGGSYTWLSAGPGDAEMQCGVFWEVRVGAAAAASGEVVVYRNRLVVAAHSTTRRALAAVVRMRLEVDRAWAEATGYRGLPVVGGAKVTREHGVAVFENLPPGEFTLAWEAPFALDAAGWVTEADFTATGPRRKAILARRFRTRIVWPVPAAGAHRQVVNLDPDQAIAGDPAGPGAAGRHIEYGRAVTVRVALDARDGRGQAGEVIWLKATYPVGNSARVDAPPPTLQGAPSAGQRTVVQSAMVGADGHAEFALVLPSAGGDVVTLSAGCAQDHCDDSPVSIQCWRRIYLQVHHPQRFRFRFTDRTLEHLKGVFDNVFIELRYEYVQAAAGSPLDETGWVMREAVPILQTTAGHDWLLYRNPSANPIQGRLAALDALAGYPPRYGLIPAHGEYEVGRAELFTVALTSRTSGWITSRVSPTSRFYRAQDYNGATCLEPITPGRPGQWTTAGGAQSGDVTEAHIEPDPADGRRFRLRFPAGPAYQEARLRLKPITYSSGSTMGRWCLVTGISNKQFAYVVAHEIGHALHQAVTRDHVPPGLAQADHPDTYGGGQAGGATVDPCQDPAQHGHAGPHCRHGLPANRVAAADYAGLDRQGVNGRCVMWGGISRRKTKVGALLKFCPHCTRMFRAATVA